MTDELIAEFDDVPASGIHTLKDGVDRTPAQMLAYQLGWMDLLLGWEEGERAGRKVVTPAPGHRWNRLAIFTTPSTSSGATPRCLNVRRPSGRGSTASSSSWHQ